VVTWLLRVVVSGRRETMGTRARSARRAGGGGGGGGVRVLECAATRRSFRPRERLQNGRDVSSRTQSNLRRYVRTVYYYAGILIFHSFVSVQRLLINRLFLARARTIPFYYCTTLPAHCRNIYMYIHARVL